MRLKTWFLFCFVAPIIATAAPSASIAEPASGEEVVNLYAAGPRALAMLTLADGPPAPVVFDTGEDKAWLVTSYAKRLGLQVIGAGPLVDEATGKHSTTPLIGLPEPKLGGVRLSPVATSMIDYDEPDMVGVFGPSVFRGRLVTLELTHHRVRLSPLAPENVPTRPASPYFHDLPAMTIYVAGIPVVAHLDSGSTAGLGLPRTLMNKVKTKSPPLLIGQTHSISGDQPVYQAQLDGDVRIGRLVLHDPIVTFADSGTSAVANVGFDILQHLTLIMDPAGQRSWVLDPGDLQGPLDQFAGRFGARSVSVQGGKLIYQREGRPKFELTYAGGDLFDVSATGDRIQFIRKDGHVTKLTLITANGEIVDEDRTK